MLLWHVAVPEVYVDVYPMRDVLVVVGSGKPGSASNQPCTHTHTNVISIGTVETGGKISQRSNSLITVDLPSPPRPRNTTFACSSLMPNPRERKLLVESSCSCLEVTGSRGNQSGSIHAYIASTSSMTLTRSARTALAMRGHLLFSFPTPPKFPDHFSPILMLYLDSHLYACHIGSTQIPESSVSDTDVCGSPKTHCGRSDATGT